MDSPNGTQHQLPQQPSPLEGYPGKTQVASQPQTVDPGGTDAASGQANPAQQQTQQSQSMPPDQESAASQGPQPPQEPLNQSELFPGVNKPVLEEILFEWQAPSRPYKHRNRQYFTTVGLISALIALILIFAGQLLPVAVIAAVFFVIYVLNSTPPGMVTHKLTTFGIRIEDKLYYWEEMGRFWFTDKFGENILNIEVSRFPNRLVLLLGNTSKEDMTLVLSEVLINQQPPPTAYEKAAQWLQDKLPIDIES